MEGKSDISKLLNEIEIKAIKRFVGRLKAKHCERLGYNGGTYKMTGNDIDDLIKEVEGELK